MFVIEVMNGDADSKLNANGVSTPATVVERTATKVLEETPFTKERANVAPLVIGALLK